MTILISPSKTAGKLRKSEIFTGQFQKAEIFTKQLQKAEVFTGQVRKSGAGPPARTDPPES